MTFNELELSNDVLKGIEDMGFKTPTPIQEKSIPLLLNGRDIIGQAQTGTGKTLAFGSVILSTLQKDVKHIQTLILSPTRELAMQIEDELKRIGKYTNYKTICVYGGSDINLQMRSLNKGVDIVVGTPGRVLDLIRRKALNIENISWMVLDEADEMLNMGFIEDIESILEKTPEDKQTALFSATMPSEIKKIASQYMQFDYKMIQIKAKTMTATTVSQYYFVTTQNQRFETLCRILDSRDMQRTLIFCKTKRSVDEVVAAMSQKHYSVEALHGDLSQPQRINTLKRFKNGHIQFLVATDVAARGIDIDDISHVINYELPQEDELYIHRIGRTGRANKKGIAYSIVTSREKRFLDSIARKTNSHMEELKIPSNDEIFEQKSKDLLFEVQERILKGQLDNYKRLLRDIPKSMQKDVMAGMLAMLYEERVGFDYQQLDDHQEDRLFLSVGSIDKVNVRDIIDFLQRYGQVKRSDIGDISIKRKFTFVSIKSNVSEQVVENCYNEKIKGRRVRLEYSEE
ncbi:MAG: DEAD/DEAH box helicase [Erysipelotrichaceae bacterium]|nr:DEAD/DEAH box helicase [Erysipelotrichaceae bacterium]